MIDKVHQSNQNIKNNIQQSLFLKVHSTQIGHSDMARPGFKLQTFRTPGIRKRLGRFKLTQRFLILG